ncbi:MAG: hypothetical protein ABR606_13585 [Vicinamibacterales bacterium]
MIRAPSSLRRLVVAWGAMVLLPLAGVAAAKPEPAVGGYWYQPPSSVPLGQVVELTLRIHAAENAPDVIVEVLPTAGVELMIADRRWTRALSKGDVWDLPVTVRFVADGEWTLGASITNKRREGGPQVSGARLTVLAKSGIATLTTESLDGVKLSAAQTAEERRRLGVAPAPAAPAPARRRPPPR